MEDKREMKQETKQETMKALEPDQLEEVAGGTVYGFSGKYKCQYCGTGFANGRDLGFHETNLCKQRPRN